MRDALIQKAGKCWLCGTSPTKPIHPIAEQNQLCCHEILNGPLRLKVLGETCCLIVACWRCNGDPLEDKQLYPLARQLAVIKENAPENYDLERVLRLRNPNAPLLIEPGDVEQYLQPQKWWE